MIGYEYDDGGRSDAGFKGETGDCLARAIAVSTGGPYREVYDAVGARMKQAGYARSGNGYRTKHVRGLRHPAKVQEDVLRDFGFCKVKLQAGPRPTYSEASERYGDCIVRTTKHWAAIRHGCLRDLGDGRTYQIVESHEDMDGCLADFTMTHERKAASVWVKEETR